VFGGRLDQMVYCRLNGVVRPKHIDIHDGFEGIDRELVDRGQEVSSSTGTEVKSVDVGKKE
jgi:hypothetical protein